MLVSFRHGLIFLKSRKSASTSVEMFLQQACGITEGPAQEETPAIVNDWGILGRRLAARGSLKLDRMWYNHLPTTRMREQLGAEIWGRSCKVTTVRNPFDRMVSAYFWQVHASGADLPGDFTALKEDFADFCIAGTFPDDREIFFDRGRFAPDVCIRYEHLADDLARVCRDRGIETAGIVLPRTKVLSQMRKGRGVAEFFTRRAKAAVQQSFGWSIERFGYQIDGTRPPAGSTDGNQHFPIPAPVSEVMR